MITCSPNTHCSLDSAVCKELWRQELYSSQFIPCLFRRGGTRLMQNKQKALFAGDGVRCKVTSSGSEPINKAHSQHTSEVLHPWDQLRVPLPTWTESFTLKMHFTAVIFWAFSGSQAGRAAKPRLPTELLHWGHRTELAALPTQLTQCLASRVLFQSPGQSDFTALWKQTTSFVLIGAGLRLAESTDFLSPEQSALVLPQHLILCARKHPHSPDNFPHRGTLLLQTLDECLDIKTAQQWQKARKQSAYIHLAKKGRAWSTGPNSSLDFK